MASEKAMPRCTMEATSQITARKNPEDAWRSRKMRARETATPLRTKAASSLVKKELHLGDAKETESPLHPPGAHSPGEGLGLGLLLPPREHVDVRELAPVRVGHPEEGGRRGTRRATDHLNTLGETMIRRTLRLVRRSSV